MLKIMGFAIGLTILVAVTVRTTVSFLDTQGEEGVAHASAGQRLPQVGAHRPTAPLCDHAETPEEAQTQLQVSLHTRSAASVAN